MVRFANEHGAMVIAEGVERKEEYDMVKSLGVQLVQGFFVHKPSANAVGYRPPVHPLAALTDQASR
jgi:EAL domain-containing protein (putative c-di-GMP-specific phosphodiesterase class I)